MTRLAFHTWKIGFSLVQLGLEKDFQESFSKGVDNIQQGQPCVGSFPTPLSVIRQVSL